MEQERKNELVLIVDDTPQNLQLLGTILKQEGYQIAVANNGKLGIQMVKKVRPDIILLDVMMPVLNGFETCKVLNENPTTQNIPVIFLTEKTETEDIVKGFHCGAVDFITKPFISEELLARVRIHLKLKTVLRELEQKNSMLEKMVIIDGLTEIYNRKHILDRLEISIAESNRYDRPLSIMMFDIDHFKRINDRFGHQFGDKVLVRIAQEIKKSIRQTDLVGRYGGEEFLVIFSNTSFEGAKQATENIRIRIQSLSWNIDGLKVSISGGLCSLRGEKADELIRKADEFLYLAKWNGRNRIEAKIDNKIEETRKSA